MAILLTIKIQFDKSMLLNNEGRRNFLKTDNSMNHKKTTLFLQSGFNKLKMK